VLIAVGTATEIIIVGEDLMKRLDDILMDGIGWWMGLLL
jgi:hypothetical protein